MNAVKINTIQQFLSATQEEKRMMFENEIETGFIDDIKNQLESNVYDSVKLSMQLVQTLGLKELIPNIFKNISVYNSIDPMGNGLDPVSLIIELGSNNYHILMDCVALDSTEENIRIAAKIIFHWFIRDPEKMEEIVGHGKQTNEKIEYKILAQVRAELETYYKSK